MKRYLLALVLMLTPLVAAWSLPKPAEAAFEQNDLIDQAKFDNVNSMSQPAIQNFLSEFPTSCLTNYQSADPTSYSTFGGNVLASQVIYDAAQYWGLNPQVILVTLEKEESLVTGGVGCAAFRYNTAMGYDCPDSGSCPAHASNAGFSQQVMHAAWQLRFNEQRSVGNTAWDGDGSITYSGYMTPGTYARVAGGSAVFYDGTATIDGTTVTMTNAPTAALYSYTPHFHGNQNFVALYEQWFGPTHGAGPAAVLYQSPEGAIYLFDTDQNILWPIPNMNVFYAYGFTTNNVDQVSDSTIASIAKSSMPLGIVFRADSSSTVFITSNGIANGFDSGTMFTNWGLSGSAVEALPDQLVNSIPDGPNLTNLSADSTGLIYYINAGNKYPITDPSTFNAAGLDWNSVIGTSTMALALVPDGGPFTLSLVGNIPVYRLAAPNGSYLYTISTVERNVAISQYGYQLNGTAFSVPAASSSNTTPVYRLANRVTGNYFYTISPAESSYAAAHGYVLEGSAFNAAATQVAGTVPVYRLVNRNSGNYFYTDSGGEATAAGSFGYITEGVAFYAWP